VLALTAHALFDDISGATVVTKTSDIDPLIEDPDFLTLLITF
jgi:hypothetical protein